MLSQEVPGMHGGAGLPLPGLAPGLNRGEVRSGKAAPRTRHHTNWRLVRDPSASLSPCTPHPQAAKGRGGPKGRVPSRTGPSSGHGVQVPAKAGRHQRHRLAKLRVDGKPRSGDRAGVCPALGLCVTLSQQLGTLPVPPRPAAPRGRVHGAGLPTTLLQRRSLGRLARLAL